MEEIKRQTGQVSKLVSGISRKLAVLVGATLAVSGATPATAAQPAIPNSPAASGNEIVLSGANRKLPPRLILKQAGSAFKMIAQHDSHSSHSSHSSHASHSSHTSGAM